MGWVGCKRGKWDGSGVRGVKEMRRARERRMVRWGEVDGFEG